MRQERRYPVEQNRDQFWIHILIPIGNSEHDDLLVFEELPKLVSQSPSVNRFHGEDGVRPLDEFRGDRCFGIRRSACGKGFNARPIGKHCFGGRTA